MICSNCGNEIKEGENFCSKCGNKIEKPENSINNKMKTSKKKSKRKIVIICVIILIIIIVALVAYIFISNNKNNDNQNNSETQSEGFVQNGSNGNQIMNISFSNMKSEGEKLNLTEEQEIVLDYFDNDYFIDGSDYSYEDLQRYPNIFENSKISTRVGIIKVIKSTDNEFEALVQFSAGEAPIPTMEEIENGTYGQPIVVKSEQLDERLIEGDIATFYGRYETVETYEIDGKTYNLPTIKASKLIKGYERYDLDDITTVAKYIFGNDIKIREAVYGVDTGNSQEIEYVVTLDNQSNQNFKSFVMTTGIGNIIYHNKENNIPYTINKNLYISADFNHYIVITQDTDIKRIYVDYFNRDLEKIWSREFDYLDENSTSMDYNSKILTMQIDNDLYLINLENGENIIEPVLVGEKIKMMMLEDSILLIGNQPKDAIMLVDYNGNIKQRTSIETDIEEFTSTNTQIVNGKIVIHFESYLKGYTGSTDSGLYARYEVTGGSKYVVLNKDGTIDFTTSDDIYTYTY